MNEYRTTIGRTTIGGKVHLAHGYGPQRILCQFKQPVPTLDEVITDADHQGDICETLVLHGIKWSEVCTRCFPIGLLNRYRAALAEAIAAEEAAAAAYDEHQADLADEAVVDAPASEPTLFAVDAPEQPAQLDAFGGAAVAVATTPRAATGRTATAALDASDDDAALWALTLTEGDPETGFAFGITDPEPAPHTFVEFPAPVRTCRACGMKARPVAAVGWAWVMPSGKQLDIDGERRGAGTASTLEALPPCPPQD